MYCSQGGTARRGLGNTPLINPLGFLLLAADIKTVLPTLDVLQNSDELQRHELSSNDNFLFLMKVFYESIAVEMSPGK